MNGNSDVDKWASNQCDGGSGPNVMSFELNGRQRVHRPNCGNDGNEKSEKRLDEPCTENRDRSGDANNPFALRNC